MYILRFYVLVLFFFSAYAYQEKPIVVVIPSYNNAQWYERNLNSVCFQNYRNYRIIYIDDCSPDGTADLVKAYIAKHNLQNKITLICNDKNRGAMANHYRAVWMCRDEEIVAHLDGDDFLKHNNVLARINKEFQDPSVLLTYGQFERFPSRRKGYCRPMPQDIIERNAFREYDWITSHIRAFYAGLFKQIKLQDFIFEGNYFDMTCDLAMMFPLLELAGKRIRCIPDVLYMYNQASPINDYKKNVQRQMYCDKIIRARKKYSATASYIRACDLPKSVVLILTDLTPDKIDAFLCKAAPLITPVEAIVIFYAEHDSLQIERIRKRYSEDKRILFFSEQNMQDYFSCVKGDVGYFLLINQYLEPTKQVNLIESMQALESTGALNFSFDIPNNSPLIETPHNCYAWSFAQAEHLRQRPYASRMVLCRKHDLLTLFNGIAIHSCKDFHNSMLSCPADLEQIGLCPLESLIVYDQIGA